MAKYEDGSYGSAAGIALIAKVLAGRCAMKYTRACRLCHGCRDCGHHQPGGW